MSGLAMPDIQFTVAGWPPAKNEAKSLLASGRTHRKRVLDLLRAALNTVGANAGVLFGCHPIGLELTVFSPDEPPADATNYLGGVGDVLEVKDRRGDLAHLGELSRVGLYENDRQIRAVNYRWHEAPQTRYTVRLWALTD